MKVSDIQAICDGASIGPWTFETCYGVATITNPDGDIAHAVEYLTPDNASFIAASRELVPAMLAIIIALKAERAAADRVDDADPISIARVADAIEHTNKLLADLEALGC